MKGKKCIKLLILCITCLLSLSLYSNANAATTHYSSATVNFYAGQQVNATVNLPWSVNPSTHRFFLNDVWFNDYDYQNSQLAYISGRIVLEVNPKTTTDFYVCGRDTSSQWGSNVTGYCLGSITVKYTDSSTTIQNNIPVYFNEISSPYTYNIFYDFSLALDASKTVDFIQFHYFGSSGYDVISRNTNWNNTTLMIMVEGRASISAFETPPSGTDIANDLLQTQVGQNNTIIEQNQTIINQDNEDRENIEQQSDSTEQDAQDAGDEATQTGTSLFSAFTQLLSALTNVNGTSCTLPAMQVYSLNLGNMNLCQYDIPPQIMALVSIGMVFIIIPLGINLVKRMIALYKEITE